MFLFQRKNFWLLAIVCGTGLWMAWPARGFAPLLFVGLIPLLLIENYFFENPKEKKKKLFGLTYLTLLCFNVFTTWWVYFASLFGVIMAIGLNTLFMTWVVMLFHRMHIWFGSTQLIFDDKIATEENGFDVLKKHFKKNYCYLFLPVFWIAFEHLHNDWDLSWPWLTLGNGFAAWSKMVQWYEYTGTLGGSLWIWLTNITGYFWLNEFLKRKKSENHDPKISRHFAIVFPALVFIPIIFSLIIYYTYNEKSNPVPIAVVQPNIDPYNEKFNGMSVTDQLNKMISLADEVVDSNTQYLVFPETALPSSLWENELDNHPHIAVLKNYLKQHPKLTIVIGAATNRYYKSGEYKSETARKFRDNDDYYDSYNTALEIDQSDSVQVYHKSKLVPGPEKMPFPKLFNPLQELAFDLGGTVGSLGVETEPKNFIRNNLSQSELKVAPIICYESIYGYYVGGYVRKGAQLLFIITNDGWWYDTPGYKQHLNYGRLRAIEMRRSIARSANTGTSAFINQRGDISQPTGWWIHAAIKSDLNLNDTLTFYALHGDYIGVIFTWLSGLILIWGIGKRFKN